MTGPHDSLEQALICLLEQRELASKLSGSLRARRDDFELTLADDVAASKELVAQMSETEEEVRGLALAAYDGVNKHITVIGDDAFIDRFKFHCRLVGFDFRQQIAGRYRVPFLNRYWNPLTRVRYPTRPNSQNLTLNGPLFFCCVWDNNP